MLALTGGEVVLLLSGRDAGWGTGRSGGVGGGVAAPGGEASLRMPDPTCAAPPHVGEAPWGGGAVVESVEAGKGRWEL